MSAGFGVGAAAQPAKRSGVPPELRFLEEGMALTQAQRCLRIWTEAADRYPVFHELMVTGIRVEKRVTEVLEKSGPIGEDHGALLRLMALSLTSGLLGAEEMAECHRICPMQEWLDEAPRRVAWSVAVGGGKTLTAASLCRGVADLVAVDPELAGPVTRGVIYSCRTHKLIGGMLQSLEVMGVPRGLVGVWHGSDDAPVPSIKREEIGRFPILLTTQAQLQNASARHDGPQGGGSGAGVNLKDLLVYGGKDRLCIWDEAFQSALAESACTEDLTMAVGALEKVVKDLGSTDVLTLRDASDDERRAADVLRRDEARSLLAVLNGIRGPVAKTAKAALEDSQPGTVRLGAIDEASVRRIKAVALWLRSRRNHGPADALDAVSEMVSAGGLSVSVLPGKENRHTVVRPKVVIRDRLQRLVILDAGYTTNLIAQMDPTVRLASGAAYAGRELTPKTFDRVKVNFYCGHSGRGDSLHSRGLGDTRTRLKLIREQVDRISRVPLGETSLVVTYSKRLGDAVDFKAEVESRLDEKCSGWRDDVNGSQRVTVIAWGEHVGSNDWRNCKHLFFVGVLRRAWPGDLAGETFAAARGDVQAFQSQRPTLIEANQAAQEIMQAIGRGHARTTINGHAGELTVHLPYKESAGRFKGMAPCPGSPLWQELGTMMPSCVLVSESVSPKASGADLVKDAAEKALQGVEADQITTKQLKPLVLALLPEQGAAISDQVVLRGLKLLADGNGVRAAAGEPCWVKPTETSRSWVRSAAAPSI